MTNEEIIARIKAGVDTSDNMLLLWQQCRLFIHSIAIHYQGKAELEDLEQEGYLALYDAVDGFKTEFGYKFLTYAEHWIKQRMQRYIQNGGTVRIPVHEVEKIREYNKLVNAFCVHLGRKPTRREIAHNLGISVSNVISLEKSACMVQIGSIDRNLSDDEDGSTVADMVPGDVDVEASALECVQHNQLKEVIWPYVDSLPDNKGKVIRLRYQKCCTYKAIGEELEVSTERARWLEYDALRSMRCSRNSRMLRAFLDDEKTYSDGITGIGVSSFNRTWTSSTERAAISRMLDDPIAFSNSKL